MHLVAISTDRLLAVTFPFRHGRIMKNYGWKIMLAPMWVVVFAFATVRQLFPKKTYYLAAVMFAIGYSYSSCSCVHVPILLTLVRERKRKGRLGAQSSIDVNLKVERRVALTLAIVIILFSVTWFPLIAVFFIAGKSLVEKYGPAYMWIRSLALSNSAMNFVVYSARVRDFRDAYISISRKMFGC